MGVDGNSKNENANVLFALASAASRSRLSNQRRFLLIPLS